jgi:hypothetical protein
MVMGKEKSDTTNVHVQALHSMTDKRHDRRALARDIHDSSRLIVESEQGTRRHQRPGRSH